MKLPRYTLYSRAGGNFKILLLVLASALVVGMLLYSQHVTDLLLARERGIVDLYAKSYEYITGDGSASGDFSFLFSEVIQAIDFPVILTDAHGTPQYSKNLRYDTTMTEEQKLQYFREIIAEMDTHHKPIRIAYNDTLVLNYVHYGESELVRQLRWLPFLEIGLAAIFILVAYVGFSYIKRSEQSNIWVGMSKETAHQMGTPLSSLMGWSERLREDAAGNPRLLESLDEMTHDIERLNKVAARFSKIGSRPDLKPENVAEVIRGVMTYIAKRIPRTGRTVDIAVHGDEQCTARINRELFEWVIENLMKNALDAMEGAAGTITFTIEQHAGKTTIDVADNGKGIDPRFHKEVFRPGYSTKKRGWGLGLSLSQRIIENYHRGSLTVKQSAPGTGTTFRIKLG